MCDHWDPARGNAQAMATASAYTNASDTLIVDRHLANRVAQPSATPYAGSTPW